MGQTSFRIDALTKILLAAVAVFLGMLAIEPLLAPARVQAQGGEPQLYIEPGHALLRRPDGSRQVVGKVVVDLRTGDIWGFPTGNDQPYPVDTTQTKPPVSVPMYLGRYDFSAMKAQ
jgi:hypothetical protein